MEDYTKNFNTDEQHKKYNLVICRDLTDLIKTVNSAVEVGYYPKGGMQYIDGEYIQTIYLRDKDQVTGEYQLCPKCNGDGHLGRYNSPAYIGTNVFPPCDVCNGNKIIIKPIIG